MICKCSGLQGCVCQHGAFNSQAGGLQGAAFGAAGAATQQAPERPTKRRWTGDALPAYGARQLDELRVAMQNYDNIMVAHMYKVANRLLSPLVASLAIETEDEYLIAEGTLTEIFLRTRATHAELAANRVRERLDAIAHDFGWQVVPIATSSVQAPEESTHKTPQG